MHRILAIETSCDETAVAIVEGEGENVRLVSSFVRSQIDIHEAYGGVVPEVAAREHMQVLFPMLQKALPNGGEDIDAIAVTAGPGLAPALRVGVEAAKGLAVGWKKPLVSVCHLEGHVYAAWLRNTDRDGLTADNTDARNGAVEMGRRPVSQNPNMNPHRNPKFPALALIVSGGHTELVMMHDHGQFERLGETLDDAAGEAFDKVAKMLDLGYPGGPRVAALAEQGRADAFVFPRAMKESGDLLFSFSGLKTAVLYTLRENESRLADVSFKADIAASFQEAVVDILVSKTMQAAKKHHPASIILAGGVAANLALRSRLAQTCTAVEIPFFMPEFKFSMDNAAMIAVAGYFRFLKGDIRDPKEVIADPNLDIA